MAAVANLGATGATHLLAQTSDVFGLAPAHVAAVWAGALLAVAAVTVATGRVRTGYAVFTAIGLTFALWIALQERMRGDWAGVTEWAGFGLGATVAQSIARIHLSAPHRRSIRLVVQGVVLAAAAFGAAVYSGMTSRAVVAAVLMGLTGAIGAMWVVRGMWPRSRETTPAGVLLVGTVDTDPWSPRAAGIHRYLLSLARGLIGQGLDVHLVGACEKPGPHDKTRELPVPGLQFTSLVTPEPPRMIRFLRPLVTHARRLRAKKPFVIHAQRSDTLLPFVFLTPHRPRVLSVHNHYNAPMDAGKGRLYNWIVSGMERYMLRRAHVVHAGNASSAAYARTRIGAGGPPVVELPVALPIETQPRLTGPFGKRIVFVGRLDERKRPDRAIEVFNEVQRIHPDATITLIGEGPLRSRIPNDAGVTVLERLNDDELDAAYRGADVLLVTSDYEIGPLVIPEAMARGTPFVSTPVGRAQVWADAGGGNVAPADVKALARAVLEVLGLEGDAQMAARHQAVEASQADVQTMLDATRAMYEKAFARVAE